MEPAALAEDHQRDAQQAQAFSGDIQVQLHLWRAHTSTISPAAASHPRALFLVRPLGASAKMSRIWVWSLNWMMTAVAPLARMSALYFSSTPTKARGAPVSGGRRRRGLNSRGLLIWRIRGAGAACERGHQRGRRHGDRKAGGAETMNGCLHPTSLHGAGQQLNSQETASCPGTFDTPQGKRSVKDAAAAP